MVGLATGTAFGRLGGRTPASGMRHRIGPVDGDRLPHDGVRQAGRRQQGRKHLSNVSTTIDGGYRNFGDWAADDDLYLSLTAKLNESGLQGAGRDVKGCLLLQFGQLLG